MHPLTRNIRTQAGKVHGTQQIDIRKLPRQRFHNVYSVRQKQLNLIRYCSTKSLRSHAKILSHSGMLQATSQL